MKLDTMIILLRNSFTSFRWMSTSTSRRRKRKHFEIRQFLYSYKWKSGVCYTYYFGYRVFVYSFFFSIAWVISDSIKGYVAHYGIWRCHYSCWRWLRTNAQIILLINFKAKYVQTKMQTKNVVALPLSV